MYWVVQYIDDQDMLKKYVHHKLYKYVKDQEMKNVEIDADIKKEYENQRKYLENSVHSLKKRLEKETQIHQEDNLNIMHENIQLINDIVALREEVKDVDKSLKERKNSNRLKNLSQKAESTQGNVNTIEDESKIVTGQRGRESMRHEKEIMETIV